MSNDMQRLRLFFRNVGSGILLLLIISSALLISDMKNSHSGSRRVVHVAIFQFATRPILDLAVKGYIEGLAQRGYADGHNILITRFNAENDLPTANAIATSIVSGGYDLVMTASTPALQLMANANKAGKMIHVFGAVTDPFASGVGIEKNNSLIRPRNLHGVGSFQPVSSAFKIALQMFPGIKVVGVPWCRNETCSEACVLEAREICKKLGIRLLEINVENSGMVLEASRTLTSMGVDAMWIGGDNTVEIGIESMLRAAREDSIPVFTNDPETTLRGALFGLGANYYTVGISVGQLAADILDGKNVSAIPVENIVPEQLFINTYSLKYLRDRWSIPSQIRGKADSIFYLEP
jgi:ABC-type uncharacterized transport system substrate-binding protein